MRKRRLRRYRVFATIVDSYEYEHNVQKVFMAPSRDCAIFLMGREYKRAREIKSVRAQLEEKVS